MSPKFAIKEFVLLNDLSLQIVGRVYNPYIRSWNYNLRDRDNVYQQIPEVLIKNKN